MVIEGIVHVDNEVMMESGENLTFIEDGFGAALGNDPCLGHLLKRKELLSVLLFHLPNLPKASATDDIDKLKHAA